ncbi:potassium channel family protein [Actinoplanes sp. NPDC049316]|uniref:potassium channel family protein n=1 Tax=Actinoplanes sp. NPDC049316 TaxID=3154727 RepID=UPI003444D9F8
MAGADRLRRWERVTELPLALVSLLALVCLVVRVQDPSPPQWTTAALALAWTVLAVDYLARLAMAGDRRAFLRREWIDLLAVLLPVLRVFLLGRIMRVLSRRARSRLANRVVLSVGWLALLVVVGASILVVGFERDAPDANIRDVGTAVWWACVTLFTVGYGDHYPVTLGGRVVAVALMVTGFALLSVVTAAIAATFTERRGRERDEPDQEP